MAWRDLPRAGRIAIIAVLVVAVVVLLFTVVFPRVEQYFEDPTLGVTLTPFGRG